MTSFKNRIGAALLSSAMLTAMLTGCGSTTVSTASSGGENAGSGNADGQHITVILKTLASEYWSYVAKGCEQAGKELGVEVEVVGATSETAYDEQLNIIETTLSSGKSDAVVIAPLQAETVATQIASADIPIIAVDTDIPSDKVLSFVGFDNEEMASMGGEAAVEAAKAAGWSTITAIGIAGVQGDSTSKARMAGYCKGIEAKGGTYLSGETQYADGVSDKAVTSMESIIQNHPEGIAIIACNNDDMALGVYDYYKEKNLKLPVIIGINNSEEMHQKIMSGEMYGTIDNKMEDQVMEICRLMQAILKKDTGSYQKVWYSTPKAIVKAERTE